MSRDAGAGVLNDERELAALCVSYAMAVDRRDGDRFAALFVEDAELVVPDLPDDLRPVLVRTGTETLRSIPDGLRRFTKTFHEVLNREFTIEGGSATGTIYCVAHHLTAADKDRDRGRVGEGPGQGEGGHGCSVVHPISRRLPPHGERMAHRAAGAQPRVGGTATGGPDQLIVPVTWRSRPGTPHRNGVTQHDLAPALPVGAGSGPVPLCRIRR